MSTVALVLVVLVALAHVWFLVLESFLWDTPIGHKALAMTPEQAKQTAVLAKNQGLYNGFLAAGLFWSLLPGGWCKDPLGVQLFFLGCVVVAGVYGAATVDKKIFAIQAAPALLALALVALS